MQCRPPSGRPFHRSMTASQTTHEPTRTTNGPAGTRPGHHLVSPFAKFQPVRSGDLQADVPRFLEQHGQSHTAVHVVAVAEEAVRIAAQFKLDTAAARSAGLLHDVSNIFPALERIEASERAGLEVLPEERAAPMILHQKLSAVMATELFGTTDPSVLSAITYHTTLRRDAALLDKVVFLADKVAWDQANAAPFKADLLAALEHSLDAAARVYLRYLWERRHTMPVIHPWFLEAYEQLCQNDRL